jgi:dipeptidyl aminopeptidase/acylaminoacyl peptidase
MTGRPLNKNKELFTLKSYCKSFFKQTITFMAFIITFQSFATEKLASDDYAKLPNVRLMTISSDSQRLAFIKTLPNGDNLLVLDKNNLKVVGSISLGDVKVEDIYFVDKDNVVIRTSKLTRISGARGKHYVKNAFVYNLDSKKVKPLLKPGGVLHKAQTHLSSVIGLSEDKKHVYMPAYVGNDWRFKPDYTLIKVNLASPSVSKPLGIGSNSTIDFFLGKNKKPLVTESYSNESNVHTVKVRNGDDWNVIYEYEAKIREINLVGITPDYKSLVILKHDQKRGVDDYQLMSLSDGKITPTGFANSNSDIDDVITDINRVVYGYKYSGFIPTYHFFDQDLATRFQEISEIFTDNSVLLKSWSDDFSSLIIYATGNSTPGDYYLFEKGKKPSYLTTARANIDPSHIHPVGKLTVKARDGLKIPTLVTIPRASLSKMKNLPAILMPHGGPANYDTKEFYWKAQALANEGYLVVQPQFRGSSGFGYEHKHAGYGEWGAKMQDDLTDTVLQLAKQGIINKDRVCIVGASYGGYAALAGGAFTPDLFKCVVSVSGVSDLPDMMAREKYDYGSNHWVVSYWDEIISNSNGSDEILEKISPSNFAENFKAPTLLLHGEDDHVVRIDQSELMYKQLKKAGKEVKFVELDGGDHQLSSAENRNKALKEIVSFVNKYIGS